MDTSRHVDRGPTARSVRAGQVELHVVEHGRGMPVLLLHGFPLDHTMWDAQVEALGRQWRAIAPDLRGFGASQVSPGTVTMEQMADDLAALLDALGVTESVVLVGLSMGGYVAFQFWRKYASRLRALVLCDTRSIADSPAAAQGRQALAERVVKEGTQVAAEAMLPKLVGPLALENDPQVVDSLRRTILANPPEGVAAALRGMAARPDVTADLATIAMPTLIIVGQQDAISTVDEMRGVAKAIAGAEFVVIPRAGHMTPVENPAAFNEAIEQFLTRVERGSASI
jgi:pimeloyl-ACP methyl ester carboxylesterase